MKHKKILNSESCPECGNSLEVTTTCPPELDTDEQYFLDGDEVECVECDFKSALTADEYGVYVQD